MSIQVASVETNALNEFPPGAPGVKVLPASHVGTPGQKEVFDTSEHCEKQRMRQAKGRGPRERACAGCRKVSPAEALLRFVRGPTRELTLDLRARLPGRGAWACPTLPCLELGVRKRGFARCLRAPVHADAVTLSRTTQEALRHAVLQSLGLCYRSGQCDFGMDRCVRSLAQGNISALVLARDLSERSRQRLLQLSKNNRLMPNFPPQGFPESRDAINRVSTVDSRFRGNDKTEVIKTHFSKRELGQALGRQEVGIVSLLHGKLARKLLAHLRCLHQLRTSLQHNQSPLENS
ncbi:MAG: DUF448 domain-containing protein [Myxococcota bacterium]